MLEVNNLHVHLDTPAGLVKAVDGVSFRLEAGQTIGIVGESGSGKSVLAHSLTKLNPEPPATYPKGEILFEGENILTMDKKRLRNLRGKEIAMIFQDPMSSLNPVFRIGRQLMEAIQTHQKLPKKEARQKAIELLIDVGIPDPERRMQDYPHQFSGGMRQRVLIAIALAARPKLLIADEPTTALDVTIQAQIIELLKSIQKKYGTSIIMITHDLGVVANLADRILVMYAGKIVESGSTADIFYDTAMPYTWSLLRSIPRLDAGASERLLHIEGHPPNLIHPPKGCNFHPRCPFARDACLQTDPPLAERGTNHMAACILTKPEFDKEKRAVAERKGVLLS
ncbi:ABC transporter ATP-binding protein [Terribacillus saccharophilus]|uniref:Oligopeptide transport system ATP-binding protein n=1 Tax=Terribacillus saccharophilus TaxID=361277 RepID=A0AAX2EEF4_9BACI|nr:MULTISPECIES: ABC transporter ATP-binding protein [Terribacillus]MCM3226650.1 ABC transporter ATP-binding protein [Terribacillus saccharophilus]MEC0281016.1 ABC transporter ATP-binding protein [Terribacillus saccharophilus]MEC0289216.1 ABC transporter ATP-binding protein [Terribacillus saccharophilus]SEM95774.1 oligopeptide transport system ATP-binding protein [Terribacillus saccharophilus]